MMPLFSTLTGVMSSLMPINLPDVNSVINSAYQTPFTQQMNADKSSMFPKIGLSLHTPSEIEPHIQGAAQQYGLDPNLLKAIIWQESRGQSNAVSHKGARGYMQLMPDTAREMGVTDITDPRQNIFGGAKYFRQMLDRFGDPALALAAYNAGPTRVRRAGNKIPNIRETRNYVASVMNTWGYNR